MTIVLRPAGPLAATVDTLAGIARSRGMPPAEEEFVVLVTTIVNRFCLQNGRTISSETAGQLAVRLRELVEERGLPPPLAPADSGQPGGMAEEVCAPLVAGIVAGAKEVGLEEVARQLVKACFYPEFKVCRESYRAVDPEGRCRRQELARVRGRISGSHCVDCPYWVALDGGAHRDLLLAGWQGDRRDFADDADTYLPDDFRALRRWLYVRARQAPTGRWDGTSDMTRL